MMEKAGRRRSQRKPVRRGDVETTRRKMEWSRNPSHEKQDRRRNQAVGETHLSTGAKTEKQKRAEK